MMNLAITACVDNSSVRVMPELSCNDSKITLSKEAGSSITSLLFTTMGDVTAKYDVDWLSVDANTRRIIYTALTPNETEEARVANVQITAGSSTETVIVTQAAKALDLSLKVGKVVDNGNGVVFWVDPNDNTIGKAISIKRFGGVSAFEESIMPHQATSVVNGYLNTLAFSSPASADAVSYCKALGDGWYLPARDELWQLFDIYNGVSHTSTNFVSAVPSQITDAEKAARATFDKMLTDLQGDAMNTADGSSNGDSYWSSTENLTGDKAYWVRFGKSAADLGSKTSTSRYVRCMRVIGNYIFPEEPATLSVSPNPVVLEGDNGASATLTMESNKNDFTVALSNDSWLTYTLSGKTVVFKASSTNTTGSDRSVTATITAGTGSTATSVAVTVTQKVANAGALVLSSTAVNITPDAVAKSDVINITSSETSFTVTLSDNSWLKANIDQTNKTIYFWSTSANLGTNARSTTALVTAGAGVASRQVTITQRGILSTEFAVGQVISTSGSLEGGIVFWVDPTNRGSAKIMSLDRSNLAWSTASTPGKTGVTLSSDDGLANTKALATLSNASEMPAIKFCTDKGTNWYWPTKIDLEEMFETYNGIAISSATSDVPDNLTDFEKANRAAWDQVVTKAGGTVMNTADTSATGDSYWASRESSDGTKGFYVRFGKPSSWSNATSSKSNLRYIRAVRSVSK